jgi:hypothetical protein
LIKNSFLNQTEVLSILGGIFVFNGHGAEGWILISLGVIGSFTKFAMNFQAEHQKEEKRLLVESEKGINELAKKLTDMS